MNKTYKDWVGCSVYNVQPAVNQDGRYLSDRNNEDIELVSSKFDVITVEDYCKWYDLYYLTHDKDNNEILVSFTYGDIIDGKDHCYYPNTVVEFAVKNDLKIDAVSYISICKMFIENDSEDYGTKISNDFLPDLEDLEKVILIDDNSYNRYFYINGKYDLYCYRNYVKQK